jgi:apolipoprotein D and lipocalin family protein
MAAQVQKFPTSTPFPQICTTVVVLGSLATLFLGACKTMPKGIETAKNFNLQKFEGVWHEIARSNNAQEAGLTHVTSQYRRMADGKWLINTRAWDGANGDWVGSTRISTISTAAKTAEGKPSAENPTSGNPASFQLGHGNPRHVVIIDNDHTLALVCGKHYRDFWIISKSPTPEQSRLERLMTLALDAGFPVKEAFFVPTQ